MYLKLKQGSKESQMRKMNQLVLRIFEYAASSSVFDQKTFEQFLGTDGAWMVGKYQSREKLCQKMAALFAEPISMRQKLYNAIEHDMEYDKHIGDAGFVFAEDALEPQLKAAAKDFILYLYENLFQKEKFQAQGQMMEFHEFRDSLFEQNEFPVCPACLAMRSDLKSAGQVDHYFPKKEYPACIFHPANLAVICEACNSAGVKGQKNILAGNNLTEIYLPYLRAAEEETELKVQRVEVQGEGGRKWEELRMRMVPFIPNTLTEKRIQNLEELFHLSKRWTDYLHVILSEELDYLVELEEEAEVRDELYHEAKKRKIQAGKRKEMLLAAACASYLADEGLECVLADWRLRRQEKETMKKFQE